MIFVSSSLSRLTIVSRNAPWRMNSEILTPACRARSLRSLYSSSVNLTLTTRHRFSLAVFLGRPPFRLELCFILIWGLSVYVLVGIVEGKEQLGCAVSGWFFGRKSHTDTYPCPPNLLTSIARSVTACRTPHCNHLMTSFTQRISSPSTSGAIVFRWSMRTLLMVEVALAPRSPTRRLTRSKASHTQSSTWVLWRFVLNW